MLWGWGVSLGVGLGVGWAVNRSGLGVCCKSRFLDLSSGRGRWGGGGWRREA